MEDFDLNLTLWGVANQAGNENIFNELLQVPVQVQPVRSSLPAVSDWPGDYGFNVTFGQTDISNAKNIHWIYTDRKLFIKKDAPCPVNFSVDVPLTGTVVRAMAVYTLPQHATDSVHRCVFHSQEELTMEKFEAEHLIRSECGGATYVQNKETQRHSVIVPFENPQAGQCFSTYIYKFVCWGSCGGGPNRRPLTLVFTLEHDNVVLGRRSFELKICANPGRDSGVVKKSAPPMAKKLKMDSKQVTVPKRKMEEKEEYTIKTSDVECFTFLQNMKNLYRMSKKVNSLPEDIRRIYSIMMSSSSEEEFSTVEQ